MNGSHFHSDSFLAARNYCAEYFLAKLSNLVCMTDREAASPLPAPSIYLEENGTKVWKVIQVLLTSSWVRAESETQMLQSQDKRPRGLPLAWHFLWSPYKIFRSLASCHQQQILAQHTFSQAASAHTHGHGILVSQGHGKGEIVPDSFLTCLLWGWLSTATGCPGRLWSLHPWQ